MLQVHCRHLYSWRENQASADPEDTSRAFVIIQWRLENVYLIANYKEKLDALVIALEFDLMAKAHF